ncbi:hypothetical protein [Xanthomonas bundabergensis]|uniref:hypothetical protein n=1 Tax=Xanthomonas bundabergensis TaxID=3160842 RepID=UPI0035169F86
MRSIALPRYLVLAPVVGIACWLMLGGASALQPSSRISSATPSAAQPPAHADAARPAAAIAAAPEPPSAKAVLDLAVSLPADFQAEVLLRMADAKDLPTAPGSKGQSATAVDLALHAYELAGRSMRRLPGLGNVGYVDEENEDELRNAHTAGLDQLSLQTRSIRLVAAHAPERVGSLLASLPAPAKTACGADYVDDPSATYELTAALLPQDPEQRANALRQRIDLAQRETDVKPALKMILALPTLGDAAEAQIGESLIRLFARVRGDDAGFTATELSVASDIQLLLQRLDGTPPIRDRLHDAYRGYVQAHLAQPRCPASLLGNHWLLEQRFVAEIPGDQIREPAPSAAASSPGNDAAVSLIRQAGFNIRTQLLEHADRNPATDAALAAASNEFLEQIGTGPLGAAAASDSSGRIQRAQLLEMLRYLEYAPAGAARDRGFDIVYRLLSGPYYQRDHDTWFGDLRRVAEQAQRWPDRALRLDQLAAHREPVVKVYALLMQRGQFP